MTQLLHIKIQFPTRSISSPDSISKTETWACHLYFILEAKRIGDSCLLTLTLRRYICFVLYIASVIWQDYEFIFEPSTDVRHPKFQYFSCSFDEGDGNSCQTERCAETIGVREKEREIYRCIGRVDTKARRIYFRARRGGTISSIKYTPPSLDKLKRRMTVLRWAFVGDARGEEARKEFREHMISLAYQIARTRSILRRMVVIR